MYIVRIEIGLIEFAKFDGQDSKMSTWKGNGKRVGVYGCNGYIIYLFFHLRPLPGEERRAGYIFLHYTFSQSDHSRTQLLFS